MTCSKGTKRPEKGLLILLYNTEFQVYDKAEVTTIDYSYENPSNIVDTIRDEYSTYELKKSTNEQVKEDCNKFFEGELIIDFNQLSQCEPINPDACTRILEYIKREVVGTYRPRDLPIVREKRWIFLIVVVLVAAMVVTNFITMVDSPICMAPAAYKPI